MEYTQLASCEDWIALSILSLLWLGYTAFARYKGKRSDCLSSTLARYRKDWMLRLLTRENRISDASLLSSLHDSVSFFASTNILIIAGLVAALAASEEAIGVLSTLPLVTTNTRELWEFKILILLVIFVYSFIEFTWSLRLYNFTCVLVGSAPVIPDIKNKEHDRDIFASRTGYVITKAANHFNYGLRAYYFALATMGWFVHPWLLIVTSLLVVSLLYYREFHSDVLTALCTEDKMG